jgi:hypothetical protein
MRTQPGVYKPGGAGQVVAVSFVNDQPHYTVKYTVNTGRESGLVDAEVSLCNFSPKTLPPRESAAAGVARAAAAAKDLELERLRERVAILEAQATKDRTKLKGVCTSS